VKKNGKVYLIGAGCGDYDLITLRGIKLLRECDTVIYDALADRRLLGLCRPDAEKIYVGKRSGKHCLAQEEINSLLVKKAAEDRIVARLKGGDPFVFGRGGEEILSLRENNIPYLVVCGISSAIAVPGSAGIPVTHRDVSRSFHVITGHTSDDFVCKNLDSYAGLDGTLVFLMGLKNLPQIASGLIAGGMPGDTPAAVISSGASAGQRTVRARLDKIAETAACEKMTAPAVIVVGKTAEFDFSPTYTQPLCGASVALTATSLLSEKLIAELEGMGAQAYKVGEIGICTNVDAFDTDRAFENLSDYSVLVLTSPNGADIFLSELKRRRIDVRKLGQLKIAVIGGGTAEILESAGIFPELMPESFTSNALGRLLAEKHDRNERVLILRSSEGSEELVKPLVSAGIYHDDISLYSPVYRDLTEGNEIFDDYLVFASGSGVRGFFGTGCSISERTKIVCIGEVTAAELYKYKKTDCIISGEASAAGIAETIRSHWQKRRSSGDPCAGNVDISD